MKKSAFISDVLFAFFTSFLFSICLFRYKKIGLLLAFSLAVFCGALCAVSVFAYLKSKRKNFFLKKSDEDRKNKLLFHLTLLSNDQVVDFFKKTLSPNAQRRGKLQVFTETEAYFLHFKFSPVNADALTDFFRLRTSKQKILLCSGIDEQARALCKQFHVEIKTETDVYALLKEKNAIPDHFLGEPSPKTQKKRFQGWLAKKNYKHFLLAATLILLSSLWTPFPTYYLIFGAVLLLASVLIRIFGYS